MPPCPKQPLRRMCNLPDRRWWTIRSAEYFGEARLFFNDACSTAHYTAGLEAGCKLLELPRHVFNDIFLNDANLVAGSRIKLLRSRC
eukprot:719288-Prymnesium_polylepis.1